MLRHPWSSTVQLRDDAPAGLLLIAGLAGLFFVLEFCGIELMNAAGMLAKVAGFLVAYPLACLAPIALGWWFIRHEPSDRQRH